MSTRTKKPQPAARFKMSFVPFPKEKRDALMAGANICDGVFEGFMQGGHSVEAAGAAACAARIRKTVAQGQWREVGGGAK
jgi:hypothetical protein